MSHPLPPLPPEAFEPDSSEHKGQMPLRKSQEYGRRSQETPRNANLYDLTIATENMSLQQPNPRSSRELARPLDETESNGHDSVGGRSRSSKELNRSPKKLAKGMRKEVPTMDEYLPPPRMSSKAQQQQGSPGSATRQSLDHGLDINFADYNPNGTIASSSSYPAPQASSSLQNASPRPRPPRIAPLEEPINPERKPRSNYPESLQSGLHPQSTGQPSIYSGNQQQLGQHQQWGSQSYPDQRDFLPQEADGFYGNTANYPYNQQPTEAGPYAQDPRNASPGMLDQSHLQPGAQAALLSNEQSLALYRANAKKSSNPDIIFEFAVFMLEASKSVVVPPADPTYSNQLEIERANEKREGYVKEAMSLLKKIADRGHVLAQYTLADCYSNGIGTVKGRQDFDRAFPLFVAAAKHNHVDAAYRAGACCEFGWGCRKDSNKAAHFYRAAASQQHPGAMFRMGQAEMNGELGLSKNPKEGVTWLKRSAEHATAEFPHALHELALCHEKGVPNIIYVDLDYAAELLGQAAELGYAPSAFRLGECYEYGTMGCQADPALSIHYYVCPFFICLVNSC